MVVSGKRKEACRFYEIAHFIGSHHSPGATSTARGSEGDDMAHTDLNDAQTPLLGSVVTKTPFEVELVTIKSKKSFKELVDLIESNFKHYDAKTLRDLTTEGDTEKLAAYVKDVGGETEFGIFFWLDQGSTQRLAGIPIESRFYLFGNATIAQGLFRFSPRAGLGAPVRFCVSQRDGEAAQIDIDLPSSFFGQIPELAASPVPKELDERMIGILTKIAS
jgi:uncharacterized protein (DUF302 family)